jgi:hypothetical protein
MSLWRSPLRWFELYFVCLVVRPYSTLQLMRF